MDRVELLNKIKEDLGEKLEEIVEALPDRIYLHVKLESSYEVNKYLFEDCGGRLATASGLDARDGVEILYHFCFDPQGCVITVRTKTDKPTLEIQSITPIITAAEWIEREIHDLLGVNFKGHPNLERLILADDWPEGVHPLREDKDGA